MELLRRLPRRSRRPTLILLLLLLLLQFPQQLFGSLHYWPVLLLLRLIALLPLIRLRLFRRLLLRIGSPFAPGFHRILALYVGHRLQVFVLSLLLIRLRIGRRLRAVGFCHQHDLVQCVRIGCRSQQNVIVMRSIQ